MASSDMNAICSQLLRPQDLEISDKLFKQIQKENIVTQIVEEKKEINIKIFSSYQLYLSLVTPILHDIGFLIIDEVTYNIQNGKEQIFVSRFNLKLLKSNDLEKILKAKDNLEKIITSVLSDENTHSSKVFSLVYDQDFDIRKIKLVRAIIEYIDQAVLTINSATILNTYIIHNDILKLFVDYFYVKFDPNVTKRPDKISTLKLKIDEKIKQIPQIIDDKILKLTLSFFDSLLRTNYFLEKETISFKIDSLTFGKNLKGLQPNLENFIYNEAFYGMHLRMSNISRGGLRWSDRHDDYRQEIKSLMITQEGKNSIIIPDGAKGGFVINKDTADVTKEYFKEIYTMFINANLDLVDNMVDGKIEKNKDMVCYDGDDAYFVVAADKGTAAMSDVANEIAISRDFWLGDAFASGGSNGYGHKELGITARGSLMSTQRFFIEEGIDIYKDSITVMGIGSMSGDVFGNGLIESDKFKLLGAIGHKEIFIDPTPDLAKSFAERKRLFESKDGGWKNYNKDIISKGGGIFLRSEKEIELTPEIKKLVGTTKKVVSGEELCIMLLTMPVDLLFNGGVGTYVKASDENSFDIGDKQNEAVRVDAWKIKTKIVCEGGNLGFTQKARIEYAIQGGRINIDGIDNAAGVDTSDHQSNIACILNMISVKENMCKEETQSTLNSMTDQVVKLVLDSNYNQFLVISMDERFSKRYLNDFIKVIDILDTHIPAFNRTAFYIPKNENINDIVDINGSIVRPVLCSLLSYSKIFLKKMLLESTLVDEQFALQFLYRYFPKSFVGTYEHEILNHPLKREIIATKMADILVNSQGCTFISDYEKLGNERFLLKIKSYLVAKQLFGTKEIREKIYSQDYLMDVEKQYQLIDKLEYILYASTRWMVKYLKKNQLDANHILDHKDELFSLLKKVHNQEIENLIEGDTDFNLFFSVIDYLRFAIPAIVIKETTNHPFKDVVVLFYSLIHEFNILDIIVALNKVEITSKNDMVLRNQVLQFIEFIVVHYTKKVLNFQRVNEAPTVAFENFVNNESDSFYKVREHLDLFLTRENKDIKEIAVTVNQMMVSLL